MKAHEVLGYAGSTKFFGPSHVNDLPANELTFLLRLADKECNSTQGANFEGAYVLQRDARSVAVPVVYVIAVETDSLARRMHQFVWNQNQTPFLIIESPSTVRIYPGFAFERDADRPLVAIAKNSANALKELSDFRGVHR